MAIPAIACTPAADACTSPCCRQGCYSRRLNACHLCGRLPTSYMGYLQHLPAADHKKGDMREVREWDTNKFLGYIPEVSHTYSVIGNMNEHQVTIVESTWGGKPELVDTTGIIDYGSLIYIALQRSKTAREAIKVMTGPCRRIWILQQWGVFLYSRSRRGLDYGHDRQRAVMKKEPCRAAIRIPDDCIAGHANFRRIRTIPFDDKENCVYSPDVVSFARKMGYYEGDDKDFDFAEAYASHRLQRQSSAA